MPTKEEKQRWTAYRTRVLTSEYGSGPRHINEISTETILHEIFSTTNIYNLLIRAFADIEHLQARVAELERAAGPTSKAPARGREHTHPHYVPCEILSGRNTRCCMPCGHKLPHSGGGEYWDDDRDDVDEPEDK